MNPFPNYTEIPRRLPISVWHALRLASVALLVALCIVLLIRPAGGLFFFWRLLVPLLPLVFLVAPGVWRNVCPLAAANQVPRLFGFTRARPQPAFLRERGYVVAIALFATIVMARRPLLDHNGTALAALLAAVLVGAFLTGTTWKGKSGWCSSICPLLPVQRLYGQTPLVGVANTHCEPCIGCTANCYDFNPGAAYQADMYEPDPDWSAPRKFFAGAFPGLVAGYFTATAELGTVGVLSHILLYAAIGAGVFFAVEALLPATSSQLAVLGGAVAANVFYWYQAHPIADSWGTVVGRDIGWLAVAVRVAVALVTVALVVRTVIAERRFLEQATASARPVRLSPSRAAKLSTDTAHATGTVVTFVPGDKRVVAAPGATLLELAEHAGVAIEAGCRMGVCGADPVTVLDGGTNLNSIGSDEASTLRRLGLGGSVRMACCARVSGPVCVSTAAEDREAAGAPAAPGVFDPTIERVVVLGNGIAGVTAADFVRRSHPDCEIHLVGNEAHHLYNRMGISRVVYGRSAMQGLYLLPDRWYDDNRITCWLNTLANRIETDEQVVQLATGDRLHYDRLILATGSASFVPPIPGYGIPGTFVLREADDAVAIRRFAQEAGATNAIVAGGGLLGLEAAHALHSLGMSTTVVELAPRVLANQTDERAGELLTDFLENLGIRVLAGTSIERIVAGPDGALAGVELADGRSIDAELLLVAAGIKPNVDLARDAGIDVGRGVLVDDRMRTSAPNVFAAGDVAEIGGRVLGLWPIAVNQAEVAARNALGDDEAHMTTLPVALLKGIGLDVLSTGRIQPEDGDALEVFDDGREMRYAKIIIDRDGRVAGGILLGRPTDHDALISAVREGLTTTNLPIERQRADDVAELSGYSGFSGRAHGQM